MDQELITHFAQETQDAKPEPVWYCWYEDTGLQVAVDVLEDQSTYTPRMLGDGMRALYRQASYLYYHLFGESTWEICSWARSTARPMTRRTPWSGTA